MATQIEVPKSMNIWMSIDVACCADLSKEENKCAMCGESGERLAVFEFTTMIHHGYIDKEGYSWNIPSRALICEGCANEIEIEIAQILKKYLWQKED
ncbi:hypothetical protein [Candidatus Borrarchaeum sp.]|uniref:hypothetical protein n=1 Tax=Candidatus Borrarchaeum sp. TaxID=2846742 RepID=UPI00257BF78F|nr:hypothetical protein [Candidatus Borrarchaeum sp.]